MAHKVAHSVLVTITDLEGVQVHHGPAARPVGESWPDLIVACELEQATAGLPAQIAPSPGLLPNPTPQFKVGDAVRVSDEVADELERTKKAVRVRLTKLGARQKYLLVQLRIAELREYRTSVSAPQGRLVGRRRLRLPPRAEWHPTEQSKSASRPVAQPVYTAASKALADRGLALRFDVIDDLLVDGPHTLPGSHTKRTRLSVAGRAIAHVLATCHDPGAVRTPELLGALSRIA